MKTKQPISKQITYWLGVISIGLVVGLGIQFAKAWTSPPLSPPNGNVGAPINTSNTGQSKEGNLIIASNNTDPATGNPRANGLIVYNGNVGIGTMDPSSTLDVVGNIKASGTICDSVGCIGDGGTVGTDLTWTCRDVSCDIKCNQIGKDCLSARYSTDTDTLTSISCSTTYSKDCYHQFLCFCGQAATTCSASPVSITAGNRTCSVNMREYPKGTSFVIACRQHSWDNSDNTATATCNTSGSWILSNPQAWGYYQDPYRNCPYRWLENSGGGFNWGCQ